MLAPRTATSVLSLGRIVAGLAVLSLLSACGLKGPLYMPPAKAPKAAPAKAPVQAPAVHTPSDSGTAPLDTSPASANPVK